MLPTIIFFSALITSFGAFISLVTDILNETRRRDVFIFAIISCILWSYLFYLLH